MNFSEYQRALFELSMVPGLTAATAYQLIEVYGSPQAVIGAPSSSLAAHISSKLASQIKQIDHLTSLHAVAHWQAHNGRPIAHCVTVGHEQYPVALRSLADAPLVLYGHGNWRALDKPAVTIVGARQCSAQGQALAFELAKNVAARGWCVVSGLARGIDAAAHRGALASGRPSSTIAVLGTGIDVVYPSLHRDLARQIVSAGGLLLTEFGLGAKPLARHFPQRNRLVAALGRATVVVQATVRSGSMMTARMAGEFGRDVLAVPGLPTDPLAGGPHELIRDGAGLLESVNDLWASFGLYD